jgi:hypothetical protein
MKKSTLSWLTNYGGNQHWYPETFGQTWQGYIPVTEDAGTAPRPRASYYAHNGYGLSWTRRRTQDEESIIFALRGKVSLWMFFAHICGEFIFPFLMAGDPGEKGTGVAKGLMSLILIDVSAH